MKKYSLIIVFLLILIQVFSQTGYRYKSTFIELEPDKSICYIQTNEEDASTRNAALEKSGKRGEIHSFIRIAKDRFFVFGEKYNADKKDYTSYIYKNANKDVIIILPRIVLAARKGQEAIDEILENYRSQISIDDISGNKAIIKCFVKTSNEVLKLVKELENMSEVEWCEPEMISDYKMNNPLYPQQYYLKNTGQNGGSQGIDINIEPAWNITNGSSNITVAVIDCGVDRDHEDMTSRVE